VRRYGLQAATDETTFDRAAGEERIIVSADPTGDLLIPAARMLELGRSQA
jgi:hypothetical protein